MIVKATRRLQCARAVDEAARHLTQVSIPPTGWIDVVRRALGMSGGRLARRLGVSRAAIYQAERNERSGAISIRQMEKIADGLGCTFVYGFVPKEGSIDQLLRGQARRKAEAIVRQASAHMALEDQALPMELQEQQIEILTSQLLVTMGKSFWEEPDG